MLILFGLVAALSHLSGTTIDYSRYNPEWNGTSRLFQVLDDRGAVMVTSLADLPLSGHLLIILAPDGAFNESENFQLKGFLNRGNTIVLLSEDETGNLFLSGLGSSIRIRRANISSIDRHLDDPSSVVAFPAGDDPLSKGIPTLLLNRPSCIDGGEPIFHTSLFSWMDADGDLRLSRGEVLQHFTVVAAEHHGNGTLYVVADPSIFINGMLAPGPGNNNVAFLEQLLTLQPQVLVDQVHSRTASAPPVIRVVNLVRESTITKMALITLVFISLSLFILGRGKGP